METQGYYIGEVTKVLERFAIEFTVEGIIDRAQAIPMYTMDEPIVGDKIYIIQGDGLLNTLFFYHRLRLSTPVIFQALKSYIQFVTDKGAQLVTQNDLLLSAANATLINSQNGVGMTGGDGKVMIQNNGMDMKTLIGEIIKFFEQISSNTSASGYPVQLLPPGVSAVRQMTQDLNTLMGYVNVDLMEVEESDNKRGSESDITGSQSSTSDPGEVSTSPQNYSGNRCDKAIDQLVSLLKDLLTSLTSAYPSSLIWPGGLSPAPVTPGTASAVISPFQARLGQIESLLGGTNRSE